MDWIKVTPETMPPERENVLVTIRYDDSDEKFVWADVRWSKDVGWEYLASSFDDIWTSVDGEVTHWMPYPKPAED